MQIRPADLAAIKRGEIDLAFRRWDRPRVLPGTRMRTQVGLVEITSVDAVAEDSITDGELRRAGGVTRDELAKLMARRGGAIVYRIGLRWAGEDPRIALRAEAALNYDDLAGLAARLERLDAASRHGLWTRRALELIEANPARRAPDLAAEVGLETIVFKRDIRKLKEFGLTESLPVGYRLSPRGEVLLAHLRARRPG